MSQRKLVVVSGGWVFGGDVSVVGDTLLLDRAVHVVRWRYIGFAGLIDVSATSDDAKLALMGSRVEIPTSSVLFCVPVTADWGLPS